MGVPTSDDEGEGRSGRASSRSRIVQGNNSACASGDVGGGGRLARGDGWRGDSSACAPTPRRPTRDGESVAVPNAGDEAPDARGAEASSSSGLKSWRDKRHCDMRSALLMSAAARVGSRGCARGLRPGDATTTPRLVQLQGRTAAFCEAQARPPRSDFPNPAEVVASKSMAVQSKEIEVCGERGNPSRFPPSDSFVSHRC